MDLQSAFKSRHFQADIIVLCVSWYLRDSLSYRDLKERLQKRGLSVDHSTIYRWVQQYSPELKKRDRSYFKTTTDSWRVDETYVKIKGASRYLYRAIDAEGNILDFLLSPKPDSEVAKRFFSQASSASRPKAPDVTISDKKADQMTISDKKADQMTISDKKADQMVSGAIAHLEKFPNARSSQSSKPLPPILWLAFALSGIVVLIGTLLLYVLIPLRTPGSVRPVKSNSPVRVVSTATYLATLVTPIIQSKPTLQPIQASLSGSYAEQTSEVYNLTTEGTLDWVHWGLHTPEDIDRKSGVQPQISSFSLIGSGTVQRDGHYSNAYIWSDGTPVPSVGQVPSGVYVTGVNNGFAIRVAASSIPRTLRVYIADNLAQGQLTASLDGKTYTDASLNMLHDPYNIEDNGIYTLVFSSSAPNQMLTVTYTALQTNGSNGYVMLQAATLQ